MPKPSRLEVREALLDAAETTILREGFQALRARSLTDAAGCALGALYTAFPDMDALILTVKVRILDRLDARVAAATGGAVADDPDDAVAALLSMAGAYLDFAWDDRRRWETLFQHHMADGRALPDWYRARLADIFGHINAPLRRLLPELSTASSLRLAQTLFSAAHGIVVLGVEGKLGNLPRDEIAARMGMLVRGVIAGIKTQPHVAREAGRAD